MQGLQARSEKQAALPCHSVGTRLLLVQLDFSRKPQLTPPLTFWYHPWEEQWLRTDWGSHSEVSVIFLNQAQGGVGAVFASGGSSGEVSIQAGTRAQQSHCSFNCCGIMAWTCTSGLLRC